MFKGSILVIDDESEIREGLELLLKTEGYQVASAENALSGLTRLEERPFDLMLLDVSLPDRNGIELLKDVHRQDPHLPIVLITAYGSIEMARAAFKSGAMDYITKPWSNDELLAQVAQAVEARRLRDENLQLKRALKQRYSFPNIIGKSERIVKMLDLLRPIYAKTAAYGHFGREEPEFTWEMTDKAKLLRDAAGLKGEAKKAMAAAD